MKALVTRRKLVDLAKLQSEEVKYLREQVENLRRRTFASFAVPQVVAPNPDERARSAHAPARPSPLKGRGGALLPAASATTALPHASPSAASRPHTTLPGVARDANAGAGSNRTSGMLPPLRGGSAGSSRSDRAVTR